MKNIVFDSRQVTEGSVFVAIVGTAVDGHDFIDQAIEQGACTIVCERLPEKQRPHITYIQVEDAHAELARLASEFYGNPSRELQLVGVTGTNGKTTTATLLYDLFVRLGYQVGLLSTVENRVAGAVLPATHTTPNPLEINRLLRAMVDAGCDYCFMEVSSHALVQRRTEGLRFVGGVFSNLTHDHLDYHGTFAEYIKAKKSFFDALGKEAFALTNIDDKNGVVVLQNCAARHRTYSLRSLADYHTTVVEPHLDGTLLRINEAEVWVHFIGRFNAYNLTAVYGAAIELGGDPAEVLEALSTLLPVAGRFETIRASDGRLAVVDYAHTPDALENVLQTIAQFKGGGSVVTVVGCGGDRDAAKRPVMARAAAEWSDRVILTSDNPRTEEPAEILRQMQAGLDPVQRRKTLTVSDRREAIRTAVALTGPSDILLIAGKGHEPYQEIQGIRHPFDDRIEVSSAFTEDASTGLAT